MQMGLGPSAPGAAGGGGGGAEFPELTNLVLRLKAEMESLADNDPVATATDQSGEGNDFTAAGAARPTFKAGIVNDKAVYRFDGTNDVLTGPDFASGFTAGEVFVVVKIDTDPPGGNEQTGLWDFASNTANAAHFPFTDGTIYDDWGSSDRKTTANPASALTDFRLYNVRSANNAWSNHLDGTQLHSDTSHTVGFAATPLIGQSPATFFLDGDIAEFVMCSSVQSAPERADLHAYFEAEYGLTIA
jgi:hypothetical protein